MTSRMTRSAAPTALPPAKPARPIQALKGVRVLSLALNLPGPAALMRCRQMGASCLKVEPPSGDPMASYMPLAYEAMHEGIKHLQIDLKTEAGQARLHRELAKTDVLITSFRPSAIAKLGLGWKALHKAHPQLSHIAIIGSPGARAEEPGHDLTYLAENGLVPGLELPATLYADMAGSLMTSEAVLQVVLQQRLSQLGAGLYQQVALSSAAAYVALPRQWGLTQPKGSVGGAHAGYRIYPCQDGRVAVAALEPHFAKALCLAAGITMTSPTVMLRPATHQAVANFLAGQTRRQLDKLARDQDIPLHTLPR